MILALVQAGVGIGLLPEMLAGPHTRRGELERVTAFLLGKAHAQKGETEAA